MTKTKTKTLTTEVERLGGWEVEKQKRQEPEKM